MKMETNNNNKIPPVGSKKITGYSNAGLYLNLLMME